LPLAFYSQGNRLNGWDNYLNNIYLSKTRTDTKEKPLCHKNKFVLATNVRIFSYNKELYKNELKNAIKNKYNEKDIIEEKFYEWKIDNWNETMRNNQQQNSPEFTVANNKWNISLYLNGKSEKDNDFLSIYLNNLNTNNNHNIFAYFVIAIRNPNNYSFFIGKCEKCLQCFNKNNRERGYLRYIKKSDIDNLVENNRTVVSVYLRILKNKNLAGEIMLNKNVVKEDFMEWKIENWNMFKTDPYNFIGSICDHKCNR
ncbi:hypothetical protein PIROE2DRAFT_9778, partial [Piromyces sp. E2]